MRKGCPVTWRGLLCYVKWQNSPAVSEFPCKPFCILRCRDLKAHLTGEAAPVCQEQLLFIFTPCRSEKESLQSSLLEAQQHIWELEMARSRVEAQVHRARQAKEAILEDVRGLRCELLAVRALSQQQCEDMAEQLRWAQEQCCKALRLWQSAQEEEKTNLMQELERQLEEQHVEARKQLEERANFLAETSLLYCTGGEMKKRSLGKSLIPRLRKAGIPPVGSAAGSVHSSPQMELQESQEMRPRPSSRSQEKTPEHAALTGYPSATNLPDTRPASLLPLKPLPPIQESSSINLSKMYDGEEGKRKSSTDNEDVRRNNAEQSSEGKGHKTSLPSPVGKEMKKKSLGKSLIPRLRKAGIPRVGSAAGSVHSSPQMELQESQEMRPRPSNRSQEKTPEHADLTGYTPATNLPDTRPASLLPLKPLPPIQESSSIKLSKIYDGEEQKGKSSTDNEDIRRNNAEQSSEGKGHKTSLLCSTGGEIKKRQLGKSLIPRLRKAGIPPVGSAAGSVHSSPQMELQESQEMRPRPSSSSQEKTPEHAGLSLSQAKETDHPSSPGLRSDKERRDSFGKTHAELCRLAKENLELKKMEILMEEMKRRQNEKSLQLPPETFEPGDAAEASFSLPPINGTAPSVQRKDPGSAMKKTVVRKQDTVPLQPSTPTLPGDGSFPCSSSGKPAPWQHFPAGVCPCKRSTNCLLPQPAHLGSWVHSL
ncbi:uncharacterized protein LOC135293243 isoform X1 [Passer domesticus]|uniref:uncharacterized protein LOC135293243 isoform X1 n=1 Tax=Passer domesticus TaxID=48849 RepID=UPI0030FE5B80